MTRIIEDYDSYHVERISEIAKDNGPVDTTVIKGIEVTNIGLKCVPRNRINASDITRSVLPGVFIVKSQVIQGKTYEVSEKSCICTCIAGRSGRSCKHLVAVYLLTSADFYILPPRTINGRETYHLMAFGKKPNNKDYYSRYPNMTSTTIQPIASHHAPIVQVVEQTHFDSDAIAENQNADFIFESEAVPDNQNADGLFDSEAVPDSQNADGLSDSEATANNQNADEQSISFKPFREFAIEQMKGIIPFFEEYESTAVRLKLLAIVREIGKMRKKSVHAFLQYEEKGKGKKSKSNQIGVNKAGKERRIMPAGTGNAPAKKGAPSKNSSKKKKIQKRIIPSGNGNASAKKGTPTQNSPKRKTKRKRKLADNVKKKQANPSK